MSEAKSNEEPKTRERVVIRFIERPGLRLIRAEDWAERGIKDHPDTLWGPENDWTVAKEDLGITEEQYAAIIRADRYFREEIQTVPVTEE